MAGLAICEGTRKKKPTGSNMKLSEWKLKFTDQVSDKLKRIGSLSDQASMRFSNLQDRVNASSNSLRSSVSSLMNNVRDQTTSAFSSISGMSGSLAGALTNPYVLALAAATALAVKSTAMAMSFETGMAKINATAQLPKENLDALRDQIIDIGRHSSTDMEKLPASFEMILSQTNDVKLSMDVLKASVKGAEGGFADLDTVAGSIAQTMNLVKNEGLNAQQVLDTFMTAKKVGAGEFKDFAQYMPQLIAAGHNLGVTFNNTAGTFAYMTSMGQSAADSAMMMQNMFGMLGKGDVQKNLAKIGVNVFNKDGAMRDMDLIFSELAGKMSSLSDQGKSNLLEKLGIQDMQAKSAFSVMITDADKLKTSMDAIRASAGEADRTLANTANPMRTISEIGNEFKGFMLDIGYAILPYVTKALEWGRDILREWIGRIKDMWSKASIVKDLFWLIGKVLGWIWDSIKLIGNIFMWVYDHTVKPIYEAINWIYDKIKDILGLGKSEIKIKASVNTETGTVKAPEATAQAPGMTDAQVKNMNSKASKGLDSVSGGGSQIRNVIVHMKNEFNIKAKNVTESMQEVEAICIKTMVKVAQGAELTMAN